MCESCAANPLPKSIYIEKIKSYLVGILDKIFLNDIGLRNGLIIYKEKDINGQCQLFCVTPLFV